MCSANFMATCLFDDEILCTQFTFWPLRAQKGKSSSSAENESACSVYFRAIFPLDMDIFVRYKWEF